MITRNINKVLAVLVGIIMLCIGIYTNAFAYDAESEGYAYPSPVDDQGTGYDPYPAPDTTTTNAPQSDTTCDRPVYVESYGDYTGIMMWCIEMDGTVAYRFPVYLNNALYLPLVMRPGGHGGNAVGAVAAGVANSEVVPTTEQADTCSGQGYCWGGPQAHRVSNDNTTVPVPAQVAHGFETLTTK